MIVNDFNLSIGSRLRAVRRIYNEGMRLTIEQFAHLLNISYDQLLNYERGKSALPISILFELYKRGINPVFILTGNEDVFANNNIGVKIKNNIISKGINYTKTINKIAETTLLPPREFTSPIIKASAGIIKDYY